MKMTFGYELELGDVKRSRKIPEEFGTWEYAETDIVNLHKPFANVAVDPLGKEPPMGGEINIRPGHSIEEVSGRVEALINWFIRMGDQPTASCVNHGHVHVRVIGLRDDISKLRNLTHWIKNNQKYVVARAYDYNEFPLMAKTKTARTYLKWDGGRLMPDWMAGNIITMARSFDDFIRIQCCGKDGVSMGRPFRYAINTYCMKHTDTIEFRCLRASLDTSEIYDSLRMARDLIMTALTNEISAERMFRDHLYLLPRLHYNHEHYLGWEKTKWPKERGKKVRTLHEI